MAQFFHWSLSIIWLAVFVLKASKQVRLMVLRELSKHEWSSSEHHDALKHLLKGSGSHRQSTYQVERERSEKEELRPGPVEQSTYVSGGGANELGMWF